MVTPTPTPPPTSWKRPSNSGRFRMGVRNSSLRVLLFVAVVSLAVVEQEGGLCCSTAGTTATTVMSILHMTRYAHTRSDAHSSKHGTQPLPAMPLTRDPLIETHSVPETCSCSTVLWFLHQLRSISLRFSPDPRELTDQHSAHPLNKST